MRNVASYNGIIGEFVAHIDGKEVCLGDYIEIERSVGSLETIGDRMCFPVILRHSLIHSGQESVPVLFGVSTALRDICQLLAFGLIGFNKIRLRGYPGRLPLINGGCVSPDGKFVEVVCNN